MPKQTIPAEKAAHKQETKPQPMVQQSVGASKLDGELRFGRKNLQANRLGDHRLPAIQRQILAEQIGKTQGNGQLQQAVLFGSNGNRVENNQRVIQRSCHTVVSGDTIYKISVNYGVSQTVLCDANYMSANDKLLIGKVLVIPDGKPCIHRVASDETLFSIGRIYNTSVSDIQQANKLKGTNISPEQALTIPVGRGVATPTRPMQTPTPAKPPTPIKAVPVDPVNNTGHDPGKDYAEGTTREICFLRKSDKKTIQSIGNAQLFFKKGITVKLISAAGDWLEVEGSAHQTDKPDIAIDTSRGWIQRVWTTMTLGDYKDVPVDDLTATYGQLASGSMPKSNVKSVILHQTGSSSGSSVLSGYSGRIKVKSTIGAHYLIDEAGKIILTVPVDKQVSHVGTTKPGFDKTANNARAIGIEHVGAATKLDLPSSPKDTTTLKKNREMIKAMVIAPGLKQLLLTMKDTELYRMAQDNKGDKRTKTSNFWFLYGDINAAQKRSTALLTSKLMTDFGLTEKDLLPHEAVSWKNIGEGENIKEYLTARFAYPKLVSKLETLVKADHTLSKEPILTKIVNDEKSTIAALVKDATTTENKTLQEEKAVKKPAEATAREALRTVFYNKFWERHIQLTGLVKFLDTSGATNPTELNKRLKAWVA